MEVVIRPTYDDVSDEAAALVSAAVRKKPSLVLGLATGKSPLGLYKRLSTMRRRFSRVRFFDLDEYYGLGPGDPRSFHHYLHEQLLDPLHVKEKNVCLFRGDVMDLEKASAACERKIRSVGGIDLQILGVGRNGHIAFNEPGSSLGSRTRPKTLDAKTLVDSTGTFHSLDEVPRFAITMGVGTILEARKILMLASGAEKAEIVRQIVEGPVTADVPASALQLHPNVSLILDEEAAGRLSRAEYWKWVDANKWKVGQ